eukprot:CAMPEP_0168455828 /NCGR_PEP_ID=MMETSP0228-20121227/50958_1 /TAXON_ID=133427 /ORGANISM="Protoceratium reticulatum, Strain CCCM 535 (=CCMP 1889)" /LENGTH=60 /DNA_ID=CAMNT_0008470699 /DNA_START=1 /DNA_END=180 /DNA_ORIENTATION=+
MSLAARALSMMARTGTRAGLQRAASASLQACAPRATLLNPAAAGGVRSFSRASWEAGDDV